MTGSMKANTVRVFILLIFILTTTSHAKPNPTLKEAAECKHNSYDGKLINFYGQHFDGDGCGYTLVDILNYLRVTSIQKGEIGNIIPGVKIYDLESRRMISMYSDLSMVINNNLHIFLKLGETRQFGNFIVHYKHQLLEIFDGKSYISIDDKGNIRIKSLISPNDAGICAAQSPSDDIIEKTIAKYIKCHPQTCSSLEDYDIAQKLCQHVFEGECLICDFNQFIEARNCLHKACRLLTNGTDNIICELLDDITLKCHVDCNNINMSPRIVASKCNSCTHSIDDSVCKTSTQTSTETSTELSPDNTSNVLIEFKSSKIWIDAAFVSAFVLACVCFCGFKIYVRKQRNSNLKVEFTPNPIYIIPKPNGNRTLSNQFSLYNVTTL